MKPRLLAILAALLFASCLCPAADVTFGNAPQTTDTDTVLWQRVAASLRTVTSAGMAISGNVAVTGSFWQTTQPISAASLPLPAGASTSALQTVTNTSLATIATNSAAAANSARNITTAATTLVKSGAGVLHAVNVNTLGTVVSTVTIYDSLTASGTKIATVNSLTIYGAQIYDVAFTNGLTIVTTGTVAPDITVSFR